MNYNFAQLKEKTKGVEEWLKKEFAGVRTGRATPNLLDGIVVDSYGAKVPISQVASLVTEDAKTIRITPWDMSQAKDIEKAITLANLGVSPVLDDKGVRVVFPDLTSERRESLIKIAKQKLEDARISLRNDRDKSWTDIQKKEKDGELTEDDRYRLKTELQKIIDATNKNLDDAFVRKEKEIMN